MRLKMDTLGKGWEARLLKLFLVVIGATLLVNVLNIFPGYGKNAFVDGLINYILNWDNSILEILDIFIVLGCLITAVYVFFKSKEYRPFLALVIFLMVFFFGEEVSYGKHFGLELSFFHSIDGADEGNFHNANFFPGLDLEFTNLFYIAGAPFFLFLFDRRMGGKKIREFLRFPQDKLTDVQLALYMLGCLILPLDGLPHDIELDQIFVNSVYFYLWIMVIRIHNGQISPADQETATSALFKYTRFSTGIVFLRMLLYYMHMN